MTTTLAIGTAEFEIIRTNHESHLVFTTAAGESASETMHVRKYLIRDRYAEAHFDRSCDLGATCCRNPLVFLSPLVHAKRLLRLALCREFGFAPEQAAPRFHVWPTRVSVEVPEVNLERRNLVQKLWVTDLRRLDGMTFRAEVETRVDAMVLRATCTVFLA